MLTCESIVSLVVLFTLQASGNTFPQKALNAERVANPITIDGILSEPAWQRPGLTDFTQKDPDQGKSPTQKTEVWVVYDDEALYVAAQLYDSAPDSIVSRIGRRDADLSADWFYVGIDSYHDKRTGFFFGVYCGGAIVDGTLYNDSWDDNSWDGIWDVKTRIDEKGWVVEMKIPYSQIRFPKESRYVWGINFGRNIERRKEEDYFVMVPKGESGWVSRFADLDGIENIHPPTRLEFLPYVASSAEFLKHDAGDPFNSGTQFIGRFGADVKYGLGNNLTLNATINPDFGQVEVDPAVVNLTQFETFYEEKRPFFIEGSGFFNFGYGGANSNWGFNWGGPDFFYSRRIGRAPQGDVLHDGFTDIPQNTTIIGAAKLTGKLDNNLSLGVMQADTSRELGITDSSGHRFSDIVEPPSYYGVARSLREFNQGRQAIGLLGTAVVRGLTQPYLLSSFNKRAFSLGVDGWTNLDDDQVWVINGWFAGTKVEGTTERLVDLQSSALHYYQRPDIDYVKIDSSRTSLSGYAGRVALNKQKGNWYLNSAFGIISPGFEVNDLGFLFRTDQLNGHLVVGYRWFDPDGMFRTKGFNLAAYRSHDFGGRRTGEGYFLFWNGQFMNYWGLEGNFSYSPAYIDPRSTRGGPAMRTTTYYSTYLYAYSDSRQAVVLNCELSASRSESGSSFISVAPGFSWKPASGIVLQFSPQYAREVIVAQWVDRFSDPTAVNTYGTRYVFGRISQNEISASIRLDWTFTPKLSLQLYLQPLISVGKYAQFKELKHPGTYTFNVYGEDQSTITSDGSTYTVDPDGGGPAASFSFDNPDFNFKSLRGNAVLRWEYLPGSTIYFVWTQSRTNEADPGSLRFGRDFSNLFSATPDNVFLVKVSYWITP